MDGRLLNVEGDREPPMPRTRPRYLTKSRFKLANECPTKLYYTGKRKVYPDRNFEDEFLAALADGGFQVGELAKALHPGGHDIDTVDHADALARTDDLLRREEIVLFEPAFLWRDMFVRVDVLVKRGSRVSIYEVKAKSCSGADESQFLTRKGRISAAWRPYVEDAVFQDHVVSRARPDWVVTPHLMLVDKSVEAPLDGLHQKFLLVQQPSGRASCRQTQPLTPAELACGLLTPVKLTKARRQIVEECSFGPGGEWMLGDWAEHLARKYAAEKRIWTPPTKACRKCQFRVPAADLGGGQRSGFDECWKHAFGLSDEDLAKPSVLDVWQTKKKGEWIAEERVRMEDLGIEDFLGVDNVQQQAPAGVAMTPEERQWLQADKANRHDLSFELRTGLRDVMDGWTFPLHFIDFETMSPAIPMHAGCRPYQALAFQYSHHLVHADGRVEHAGQHLEDGVGKFPNFRFIRNLRDELSGDEGTIFRYATHENSILCGIRRQLLRAPDRVPDARDLVGFIESIARPQGDDSSTWTAGPREMVDLLELVKQYYYHPLMGGSNSIKKVLPAVLNTSDFLRRTYSEPIYGSDGGIPSLNFRDMRWVEERDGQAIDPYKLLPTMFEGFSERDCSLLLSHDGGADARGIDNGGAAMTAFARMQFSEMAGNEREHLRELLLKYCELDTLAMVMIYQAWRDWLAEQAG